MIVVPEQLVPVHLLEPKADAGGRTGTWVGLKNAQRAFIVFYVDQGNAATIAVTINQAVDSSGTSSKAITNVVPIWSDLDCAASPSLVRRTSAVSYTTDAGVKKKIVVFEIDPAALDIANSFVYITAITGASNAANITSAMLYIVPRFAATLAPSIA